MSDNSSIEWTDATWNPVTGCTKVSPGCKNCYAERFAERFRGVPGHPFTQGFDVRLWPDRVQLPLKWARPRRIFVNSMSDLFHPRVPFEFIAACFATMKAASWHHFQVLTKRPERALELSSKLPWPSNVWMGTSVESQRYVARVDSLRGIPANVRFLSCEPLLGPLTLDLKGIHWVIAGGESGPGARIMDPAWAASIQAQCKAADVSYFLKQMGTIWARENKSRTTKGGDISEWPTKLRVRQFPRLGLKHSGRQLYLTGRVFQLEDIRVATKPGKTTVVISRETRVRLDKIAVWPETVDSVISRLLDEHDRGVGVVNAPGAGDPKARAEA